jgi:NDP-sugar pyrophosphorylase family protein
MKAMILAAGLGTRLKPLTDTTPKALVTIKGKPMLEHLILKLKASGFYEIVINVHHFGEQIMDFLRANDDFGLTIHISDERKYLLDTGGGLKQAAPFLRGVEPFLVHNVDIFSDVDLATFYHSHRKGHSLATLLVSKRHTSRYLLFDKENNLCGRLNRETGEIRFCIPDFTGQYNEYAFGGVHVISPEIFSRMEEWTGKFSIIDFYISACVKNTISACFVPDISLFDVGKSDSLEATLPQLKFI